MVVAAGPAIRISIVQLDRALHQVLGRLADCTWSTGDAVVLPSGASSTCSRGKRPGSVTYKNPALQLHSQARHLEAASLCRWSPAASGQYALVGPLLDHPAEVYYAKLAAINTHEVHVRLLSRRCHKVLARRHVSGTAVPLAVHRLAQREALGRLPPGGHLELHDPRVHTTAENMLVIWRKYAHHVVAASVQGLDRVIPFKWLPKVPDLACVVERGCCKDVRGVVAEAADVDEVLVNTVGSMQHLPCRHVVDCYVRRDATGQQKIVSTIRTQRGELGEFLDCLNALQCWL
mmetsp:Transcript_18078/g.52655  ORF Transcript_18078/g.52655 Transcript_18078/m.52655 type:complete len:290 (+) Transcript_18078:601-1470(+)